MRCTLKPDLIPQKEITEGTEVKKSTRKVPTTSIAVWDLDEEGWRAFGIETVQTFAFDVQQVAPPSVEREVAKPKWGEKKTVKGETK